MLTTSYMRVILTCILVEMVMALQLVGVSQLTQLMRAERRRDLDSSWLLFGPVDEEEVEAEASEPWKYAAE